MFDTAAQVAGAACVVVAASLWGEMKARGLIYRLRQLQQFHQGLRLLDTEISYTATPLPYAFSRIGDRIGGPVGGIFLQASRYMQEGSDKSAREAWVGAIDDNQNATYFTREDRKVMEALGVSLGLTDREGQLQQIQMVSGELEYALEEARRERSKHERMWRYLGVLGGVALVIFLI